MQYLLGGAPIQLQTFEGFFKFQSSHAFLVSFSILEVHKQISSFESTNSKIPLCSLDAQVRDFQIKYMISNS